MKNKIIFSFCILIYTFSAKADQRELVDKIAATVNGKVIPFSKIQKDVEQYMQFMMSGKRDAKSAKDIQYEMLEKHISETLMQEQITANNIEISDLDVMQAIKDIQKRNEMTAEQFEQAILQQGMNLDQYKKIVREQLLKLRVIDLKVKSKINVSDNQVMSEYRKYQKDRENRYSVRAQHILIKVPIDADNTIIQEKLAFANSIIQQLHQGKTFTEMAEQYSEDPNGESGGDLGEFSTGDLFPEFDSVLSRLKVNEISNPIRTAVGFHIVKINAKTNEPAVPFEQMKLMLYQKLYEQMVESEMNGWLEKLKQKSNIKRFM